MTTPLTINGVTYNYPETGNESWGTQATNWAEAVTNGMLQKAGGSFILTAEVDFGVTYGLKTAYYKSQNANPAILGAIRLGNADDISWRNNANNADLSLAVSSGDVLQFNGETIPAGLIENADVAAAAAIAFTKMAALTASRAVESDGSGFLVASSVTSAELGHLSGVSSPIQTQLDARLPLAGGTMTGDLILNATPTADLQAATKAYVDLVGAGLAYKDSVVAATTTAGTLASDFENGDTIDGVVLATNDRILIKNQADASENGIYTVNATGAPTRATDADTWNEILSAFVFVTGGTANDDTNWVCNVAAGGTIGVDDVTFVQYNAPGTYSADGEGIEQTATVFSLELDGSTLSKSASGLTVATGGITNTQINASAAIAVSKLAALTASRAVVSDGSGFLSPAATTAIEIGHVNGVTSPIQTQLDGKIANTLLTTENDLIYASAANTPARLAAGADGYSLRSNSGVPTWTNRNISKAVFQSSDATLAVPTTWTSFALAAAAITAGSPWTRSGNDLTAIYTGSHRIVVELSTMPSGTSANRYMMVRLRNTTDGVTIAKSVAEERKSGNVNGKITFILEANITDIGKTYQIQLAASGSSLTIDRQIVAGETSLLWQISIERDNQ